MLSTYEFPEFEYVQSSEQKSGVVKRHQIVIVGAGPIGLTAALDFSKQGFNVVVLDDNNTVSIGSRAVGYAKRSLEIWDRLGVAEPMIKKGVSWSLGKVFQEDHLVYEFNLLPDESHKMPGFINLQQYYLEEYLLQKCNSKDSNIDIRWKSKAIDIINNDNYVSIQVETPDGIYKIEAEYLIACDGAKSDIRNMLGLEFDGKFFQDRFLIADVVMKADFPTERWFWFNPPFHPEQSVLLHKQADNVWRIDFQLGWDADPEQEKLPENVVPRLKAMLGDDKEFELEWVSIYQFACRQLGDFRVGRVFFAGDSAHQVSPFGGRGANSGVQDIDNLAWKIRLVTDGLAPSALLDTYSEERVYAARDNLLNSTRSTDFITPKSDISRDFRDAVLELSKSFEFARPLVNSGRLSTPTPYKESSLITQDTSIFSGDMKPGVNCSDAPIDNGWFLNRISDSNFKVIVFNYDPGIETIDVNGINCDIIIVGKDIIDTDKLLEKRYDGKKGTTYLIRPDQYISARWRSFDIEEIKKSIYKSTCNK